MRAGQDMQINLPEERVECSRRNWKEDTLENENHVEDLMSVLLLSLTQGPRTYTEEMNGQKRRRG